MQILVLYVSVQLSLKLKEDKPQRQTNHEIKNNINIITQSHCNGFNQLYLLESRGFYNGCQQPILIHKSHDILVLIVAAWAAVLWLMTRRFHRVSLQLPLHS